METDTEVIKQKTKKVKKVLPDTDRNYVMKFKIKDKEEYSTHFMSELKDSYKKGEAKRKLILDEDNNKVRVEGIFEFNARVCRKAGNLFLQYNREIYNKKQQYDASVKPKEVAPDAKVYEPQPTPLLDFLTELGMMPDIDYASTKTFQYKDNFMSGIITKLRNLDYESPEMIELFGKEEYKYFKGLYILSKASTDSTRYAIEDQEKAYKKFFDNIKSFNLYCSNPSKNSHLRSRFTDKHGKFKRPKSPKFKTYKDTISFRVRNLKIVDSEMHLIKVPKIGVIKLFPDKKYKLPDSNTIITIASTIIKESDGWHLAIGVEGLKPDRLPVTNKIVGLDLGVKVFAYPTEGDAIENPRHIKKYEDKLKKLQQQMERQKHEFDTKEHVEDFKLKNGTIKKIVTTYKINIRNESANRLKTKKRIAQLHQKIKRLREINLHRLSKTLLTNADVVITEDLNVKGLTRRPKAKRDEETGEYEKNHASQKSGLNKAILDCGWYKFTNQLEYKSKWYGKTYIKVPAHYTSRDCSTKGCGFRLKSLPLSVREWQCPECNVIHERDHNASKNILAKGIEMLDKGVLNKITNIDIQEVKKAGKQFEIDNKDTWHSKLDQKEEAPSNDELAQEILLAS